MTLKIIPDGIMGRWVATIGSYTMASRLLGFLRDILIAATLGAGPLADIFFVAFKFPNFFRRLFAEGAFNSAFIPLFAKELEGGGRRSAIDFAEEVLSVFLPSLIFLVAIAQILMPWLMYCIAPGFSENPEKFDLAVHLTRLTFQYILFISLVSMLGGVLNSLYRFAAVAATPMILNLSLIFSLEILGQWFETPAHALAIGVTLGGIIQFIWLLLACERAGISLKLRLPTLTPRTKKLIIIAAPVAVGAGVAQINLLIDVIIASFLPEGSVSFLYYADRVSQLPLGVVGVAVGTALLPLLSRQLRSGNIDSALKIQNNALHGALLLTIPATIALVVLSKPVIVTLFERGEFTSGDSIATADALLIYALGLPAFVLIKVLVPAFFARENTKTPVLIAAICVCVNVVLNLLLMKVLGHLGIALATSISGWLNAILLGFFLHKQGNLSIDVDMLRRLSAIIAASGFMGAVIWIVQYTLIAPLSNDIGLKIAELSILIMIGIFIYFPVAYFLRAFKLSEVRSILNKKTEVEIEGYSKNNTKD